MLFLIRFVKKIRRKKENSKFRIPASRFCFIFCDLSFS